jgi:HAD superfamily hydrolase (TIGR01549 family)
MNLSVPTSGGDSGSRSGPRPPRAVLFDLDDTLWPIGPVIAQAEVVLYDWLKENTPEVARQFTIETLREHRMALLEQEPRLRLDLGALRRAGLAHAFELAGADPARLDSAMLHYTAARNAVTLYDDVLPGLMRLQDKVLVGSISNGNANLEVIGLAHHFKVSLAAATFGHAKPEAAIFHAACEALGVAPSEAIYVGDDLQLDVVGAQNAGLRAVWMNRQASAAHLEQGVHPDAVCTSFAELLEWLERQLKD